MAKEFECEKDGFVKTALACCVRSPVSTRACPDL